MSTVYWQRQKEILVKELQNHMNFLIGSVVTNQHKCGKAYRCNGGKGHTRFYLSMNREGKTRNFYLNRQAVDEARTMSGESYAQVKRLLKQISDVNYQLLRERLPGPRRSSKKRLE